MFSEFLFFMTGVVMGSMLFEPFIINFLYMSNVALFNDIILSSKSRQKLKKYYMECDD